ncbi:MaoC family dehydratase N-terminal domain-containing protein [Nocardia zapadnayensis]|uniref:FAS1-like dehydratase domain-containing protein n=1 Tax=Nocardia rhamnosiphila TaxID=426716 RepID=UPI002245F137|nr:MaoC family dehydratase N-terminal domain-containing protein [Nocardia zapadnayensis]MCX0275218.1 MaoC family dehydratase N-terminal domain-containing protein [Nocardia zapadnayensis]
MSTEPTQFIGRQLESFDRHVTRQAVGEFAAATGETNPMYFDVAVARELGMKDIPAPPTFMITLEIDHRDILRFIRELGLDTTMVLHGEQAFHFRSLVYAGDAIQVRRRITDAGFKGGTMTYLVTLNTFHRGDEVVATSECTWLIKNRQVIR